MTTSMILRASSGLVATALFVLSSAQAAEEQDPLASPENQLTLAGQVGSIKGDAAAYQAKNWTSKNGFAGIEDFRLTKSLKNDFELTVDGHALPGNADYLAHINVSKNEFGSLDVGYSAFRTYYDGIGGFFPTNSAWFPLKDQNLYVDRTKFWAQASLKLPKAPSVTVRYTNEGRRGTKDTTIWGDTDNTGLPLSGTTVTSANKKIVANYVELDELRQTLEGTVKHTIGKMTLQGTIIGEQIDNMDTRYINKFPGEANPRRNTAGGNVVPAVIPWYQGGNAISGYHSQGIKTDALSFIGKVEVEVSEKVSVFVGASFQDSESDFSGERPLTTSIAVGTFANYNIVNQLGGYAYAGTGTATVRGPGSFQNLNGNSKTESVTINAGVDLKLAKSLFIEAAVKMEERDTKSASTLYYQQYQVDQLNNGAITNNSLQYVHNSHIDERAWIPELSLRYNGIKNVSLYGSAEYRYQPGIEDTVYGTSSQLTTNADVTENHGNYKLGVNWNAASFLTTRAEVFQKDHRNDFAKKVSTAPTDQGQFILGTKVSGARLSLILKPLASLSSTTRYIYQTGTMDLLATGAVTAGLFDRYPKGDTADITSHQISETIDWTPYKQLYVQANVNVTFDTTQTAYPTPGTSSNDVIRNADNNYWNASLITGFVVDKVTNAELQYTVYKADNYRSETWITQDVGAGAENYSITASIKRKIASDLVATFKVGYVSSNSDTTGNYADYSATVAYVSLQKAF